MRTCLGCGRTKTTQKFEGTRGRCRECRNKDRKKLGTRSGTGLKNYRLKYMYGITLDDYNKKSEDQNHSCAICHKPSKNQWGAELVVDHCHTTGKIRQLLCDKCNRGLGQFDDNIELFEIAIQYIKKHKT